MQRIVDGDLVHTDPYKHKFLATITNRWVGIKILANGCGRFFNAARDTVSDKFLTTYPAGEARPDISKLTGSKA